MVYIYENQIPVSDVKEAWENAVVRGVGERPDSERWRISIYAPPLDSGGYRVQVERPDLPGCPKMEIQFLPYELDLVENRTRERLVDFP